MSEYIIRETGYPGAIKKEIVQELVRCKDCKRWKDPRDCECPYHKSGDPYIDDDPEEDFFCKLGERREDDG